MGACSLSFYYLSNKWKRPIKLYKHCKGHWSLDIGPFSVSWFYQKETV